MIHSKNGYNMSVEPSLKSLRTLVAVSETSHVARAAEVLGIPQPTVSRHLHALQNQLGISLVEPDGRGIRITIDGHKVAERARQIVEAVDSLCVSKDSSSTFVIATYEVFSMPLAPFLLDALGGSELVINDQDPGGIESAVANAEADIGLTYLPIADTRVRHLKIGSVVVAAYGRSDAPANSFVVPLNTSGGTAGGVEGIDGWPIKAGRRDVVARVTSLHDAIALCRSGIALAYIPDLVADAHNAQAARKFKLQIRPEHARARKKWDVFMCVRHGESDARVADLAGIARRSFDAARAAVAVVS